MMEATCVQAHTICTRMKWSTPVREAGVSERQMFCSPQQLLHLKRLHLASLCLTKRAGSDVSSSKWNGIMHLDLCFQSLLSSTHSNLHMLLKQPNGMLANPLTPLCMYISEIVFINHWLLKFRVTGFPSAPGYSKKC